MIRHRAMSSLSLLVWILLAITTVDAIQNPWATKNSSRSSTATNPNDTLDDTPGVPFLIERIGKEIYAAFDRPKYKLYIYMTIGKLPNETSTIIVLNLVCNLLYSIGILAGFIWLPRGYMLMLTLATLFVGPALVLLLLGSIALLLVAFALYPVTSVFSMWIVFFLTSRVAQSLGRRLGLDQDKDGDCDMLDLLHYAAASKWGIRLGLPKLYQMLHESTLDPFQEIHRRLDQIHQSTQSLDESLNSPKKQE